MTEEKYEWKKDIIQNKLGGKREWTDQERMELCQQLDKELQDDLKSKSFSGNRRLDDRWTEDNWREKMAEHPLFSPYLQPDKNEIEAPINELSEGLAQLKYDPEHSSPVEIAQNYKEEGIFYFKCKKYQNAITSFTEALKIKCSNEDLNAQLYNNRSAAHFYLGNYRISLSDSCKAIEKKPAYIKAFNRAIECATRLRDWDKMIELCSEVLLLESSNEHYKKMLAIAIAEKKKFGVEKRKNTAAERKRVKLEKELLSEIRNRGIKINSTNVDESEDPSSLMNHLQPRIHTFLNSIVHLNTNNELIWPVLFLYPEHDQTDNILKFNENTRFLDHFEMMFGVNVPPVHWDTESKYKPENLNVYHPISSSRILIRIDPIVTLKEFSSSNKLETSDGILSFIILVKGSYFEKSFIKDYVLENQ